jgi:HEAT repeat protein
LSEISFGEERPERRRKGTEDERLKHEVRETERTPTELTREAEEALERGLERARRERAESPVNTERLLEMRAEIILDRFEEEGGHKSTRFSIPEETESETRELQDPTENLVEPLSLREQILKNWEMWVKEHGMVTEERCEDCRDTTEELLRYFDAREQHQMRLEQLNLSESSSPVLCAVENFHLRETLIPPEGSSLIEVADTLHTLIKAAPTEELLELLHRAEKEREPFRITDYKTYVKALQAFPSIQNAPTFDEYHYQAKVYFSLDSHLQKEQQTISQKSLEIFAQCSGLTPETLRRYIHSIKGEERGKRPRLLSMLEHRIGTLPKYQERVGEIRKTLDDIRTIQNVESRIDSFALAHYIKAHSLYRQSLKYIEQNLVILDLIEVGYHPTDLAQYWRNKQESTEMRSDPRARIRQMLASPPSWSIVRFAIQIPKEKPLEGHLWLPTENEGPGTFRWREWIQVPSRITNSEQLDRVLEQLPAPTLEKLQDAGIPLETFEEWKRRFGRVNTVDEKRHAIAYLIGASLSDGSIRGHPSMKEGSISGSFRIAQSTKHSWSKDFGDLCAYYWTCLGFPTTQGKDETRPSDIYPKHVWSSCQSPFFLWVHNIVLGLPPNANHTDYCAQADWVFNCTKEMRKRIIQGYFDGDGDASPSGKQIKVASCSQTDFIEPLLRSLGIKATRGLSGGSVYLRITSNDDLRRAINLPVFKVARGRQENADKILKMIEGIDISYAGRRFNNLPVIRLVQKLGESRHRSHSQVRELIFDITGITLGRTTIRRIIKEGEARLRIDWKAVTAFFSLYKQELLEPTFTERRCSARGLIASLRLKRIRQIRKDIGTTKTEQALQGWLGERRVPRDVVRALSEARRTSDGLVLEPPEGPRIFVTEKLLNAYPHLRRYLPDLRVQEQAIKALREGISHPQLERLIHQLQDETLEKTILAIGELRDPLAVPHLISLLKHPQGSEQQYKQIQYLTVIALGMIGDTRATRPILETFPKGPDLIKNVTETYDRRERWIFTLGQIGDSKATHLLVNLLRTDSDPLIRRMAAISLGKIDYTEAQECLAHAVPMLLFSLKHDPDIAARSEAAKALLGVGHQETTEIIIPLLQENRIHLDRELAKRLAKHGKPDTVLDILEQVVEEDSPGCKVVAIWGLRELSGSRAEELLEKLLKDKSQNVRHQAKWALKRLRRIAG